MTKWLSRGKSVVCENIFSDRLRLAYELNKMGADITVDGNCPLLRHYHVKRDGADVFMLFNEDSVNTARATVTLPVQGDFARLRMIENDMLGDTTEDGTITVELLPGQSEILVFGGEVADLIYLPETPFDDDKFINEDFYKTKDIHVHFPEGAVPKDGPSAGITVCTAIVSALTSVTVRRDVAMTGEISIRGRVLPIGGLREKTMAALRHGIRTVIIPKDNERDLEQIDQTVRNSLNFVTAQSIDSVLRAALNIKPEPIPTILQDIPEDMKQKSHKSVIRQ